MTRAPDLPRALLTPEERRRSTLRKRRLRALVDAGAWAFGLYAAAVLRLDFDLGRVVEWQLLALLPVAIALQWSVGYATRLYRDGSVFGSIDEVADLAKTVGITTGGLLGVVLVGRSWHLAPISVVLGGGLIAFLVMGGIRYGWRARADGRLRHGDTERERVLVFGAGDAGQQAVTRMLREPDSPYVPVGLLDDDPDKRHLAIRGVRMVGTRDDIARLARELDAKLLLVAVPSGDSALVRDLVRRAADADLDVRVLPSVRELFDGTVHLRDIRTPNEADLLGRHQVRIDTAAAAHWLTGRRVLVTGAGGSIGAELCRQISEFDPAALVMIDRDESALHAVKLAIDGRALLDSDDLALVDIRDRARVARIFDARRPEVVFHAAALKHLPLLEGHPAEAIKSNIWGTLSVLDAAAAVGVERFVNISTDKAANPCSVLGYSKRVAERLTACAAAGQPGTYLSVRFGNVLGSRGSVLTSFRSQIDTGGPLTVTHPDVTRYFMTVEEAVQLVIQATAIGGDGHVLVLDMGEPVRIAEVATRLADTAYRPIDVVFTGLRPGEKLHEELVAPYERARPTTHPMITSVDVAPLDSHLVRDLDPTQPDGELRERLRWLCNGADPVLFAAGGR